ncbi:MAG: VOC family protein [Betaproteobacteria bacterium]
MTSRHRTPQPLAADHLIVAAETLPDGVAWITERLGVAPASGGRHVAMGTHNALLRLGDWLYLEVIAIDPSAAAPSRPRWMDLDEPRMRATLSEGPALVHWAARSRDIDDDAQRSPIDLGTVMPMSRGEFRWRLTVPDDGHLPGRGLVPTLIEWPDERHPATGLPPSGVELVALAGEHPEPAPIREALAGLGLSDTLKVTYGRSPRLAAMLRTPRGIVTL